MKAALALDKAASYGVLMPLRGLAPKANPTGEKLRDAFVMLGWLPFLFRIWSLGIRPVGTLMLSERRSRLSISLMIQYPLMHITRWGSGEKDPGCEVHRSTHLGEFGSHRRRRCPASSSGSKPGHERAGESERILPGIMGSWPTAPSTRKLGRSWGAWTAGGTRESSFR